MFWQGSGAIVFSEHYRCVHGATTNVAQIAAGGIVQARIRLDDRQRVRGGSSAVIAAMFTSSMNARSRIASINVRSPDTPRAIRSPIPMKRPFRRHFAAGMPCTTGLLRERNRQFSHRPDPEASSQGVTSARLNQPPLCVQFTAGAARSPASAPRCAHAIPMARRASYRAVTPEEPGCASHCANR